MEPAPTVSVVIATYNRSQVLKHAIRSVLESTFTDWSLIIVGDGCTDDTAECVASFGDARICFVNLETNCGDQSGPNNHGIALARGRYVAFLNQDDLYLPEHLETCVAALEASGADLVWVPCAVAGVRPDAGLSDPPCTFQLHGVAADHGYSPFSFCSASSWVFRRELAQKVGPWPRADEAWVSTSQAWLFRAWRSGAVMRFVPRVGVLLVWSGARQGSYAWRESPEHERLARWMREDPRFRERMLEEAAVHAATRQLTVAFHTPLRSIARALLHPVYALLEASGIPPRSLHFAARFGRRGGFVRWHRRFTGAGNGDGHGSERQGVP